MEITEIYRYDMVDAGPTSISMLSNTYMDEYAGGGQRSEAMGERKIASTRAEIISDPSVMSGEPVVRGTRVPAETIVAYLRGGHSNREIFEDYPSLPIDGIDAVIEWAEAQYGPDWRSSFARPHR
ncbi:MAG: DUF433 domain-containing protein [Rhodopseudomonas palustris]|uniref:DUF433 domain-containing protein n=1 Tax=Rhodopseudomonas palustris TaxID=1076 RepID=A0A933RVD6_RHOPL|nr:DUF433 domain-containing protein [Rhodopseudomonas palustris]